MSVGYTGGWCLKYVQDAFGTDHPFVSAIDAWNANYGNGNHVDMPPLGITVPVYFTLANVPAGHVAIRLSDGWVASSTQPGTHATPYYHKSLDDLIAIYSKYNGAVTYVGWSEYVGTIHVVEDIENATADQINRAYEDLLGRPADADGIAHYEHYTLDFVHQDIANSPEHRTYMEAKQAAANPVISSIQNTPPVVATIAPSSTPEPAKSIPVVPAVSVTVPTQPAVTDPTASKPEQPNWLVRFLFVILSVFTKKG
jgi:hypothetical protein